jgi:hypothetical protein
MSRPWRIEYEGALYHLLSRGNGRSDIIIDEKDHSRFLEAVGEMSQNEKRIRTSNEKCAFSLVI